MGGNRSLHEIEDDLMAACLCLGVLVDHVGENGIVSEQVLINIERTSDGFRRLMVERRAAKCPQGSPG
jgi:hypothetical protein